MSIIETPLWQELKPYVVIQEVPYDHNRHKGKSRIRLEIKALPLDLAARAVLLETSCAACGGPIHPIRGRYNGGRPTSLHNFYIATTHPLSENISCSRGAKASLEYDRIRQDIGLQKPTTEAG